MEINWSALSAIGSLLAALTALFIALCGDWARDKIFGPDIRLEFLHGEPFVVAVDQTREPGTGANLGRSWWLRVRVTNAGRGIARGCRVKLHRAWVGSEKRPMRRFDALILRWVSPAFGPKQFSPLDILPKDSEFCNVISMLQRDPPIAEVEWDREARGSTCLLDFSEYPLYWLEVRAYGENFQPASLNIKLEGYGQWQSGTVPSLNAFLASD